MEQSGLARVLRFEDGAPCNRGRLQTNARWRGHDLQHSILNPGLSAGNVLNLKDAEPTPEAILHIVFQRRINMRSNTLQSLRRFMKELILTVVGAWTLTGCALVYLPQKEAADNMRRDWGTDRNLANFYWPYAAMATNVYRSRGQTHSSIASAVASPWLREEITARTDKDGNDVRQEYANLSIAMAEHKYRERVVELCIDDTASGVALSVNCDQVLRLCAREVEEKSWLSGKAKVGGPSCDQATILCHANFKKANRACRVLVTSSLLTEEELDSKNPRLPVTPFVAALDDETAQKFGVQLLDEAGEDRRSEAANGAEPKEIFNRFVSDKPSTEIDCNYDPKKPASLREPKVPVHLLDEEGWRQVPELHKETHANGWRLFIPELAIDVWRKSEVVQGAPVIEYAIVFRGTTGGGGIWSNLRGMVFMFEPFVWDQYRQARRATIALIDQIDRLHKISDHLNKRAISQSTKIRYTTVGHSLGGGLAVYIHLREPRVSRSVTFNGSPIDGASTLAIPRRPQVQSNAALVARPPETGVPVAQMYRLNEVGEPLSGAFPCQSGPIWGAEGGPLVQCDRANLSDGGVFHQHNMAQLSCKLFARKLGLPKSGDDHAVAERIP